MAIDPAKHTTGIEAAMPQNGELVREATIRPRTTSKGGGQPARKPGSKDSTPPSSGVRVLIANLKEENRSLRRQLDLEREQFQAERQHFQEAERELEVSRDGYAEVLDSAPVGFLTLSSNGWIRNINVTGAQILGLSRRRVIGSLLIGHIAKSDHRKLLVHLSWCRKNNRSIVTELRLKRTEGDKPVFVELTSMLSAGTDSGVQGIRGVITDITARKQAEARAREHEGQARLVSDLTPVLFSRCSHDLRYAFVNHAYADFLRKTRDEIEGKPMFEVLGEKAFEVIKPHIQKVLHGRQVEFEAEIPYPTGRRFMHVIYTPETDERGRMQGWVSVISDVTERRKLQTALDRVRRLPSENPSPVMRLLQGRYINYANPTSREVLDQWRVELGDEPPRGIVRLARRALATNEKVTHDVKVGSQFFQIWFAPVRSAGYVNLYFSDVTARKQAEEAVRQQADLLRLSFDAIIVWRQGGVIESWNRGAEMLYGFTAEEAVGHQTHELLSTTHPVPWRKINAVLRADGNWEGELRHRTKDGKEVIVSARHQLIRGTDGILRVLETNRDITAHKLAEARLHESETRLSQLAENIHEVFWLVSPDWNEVLYVSAGYEKLWGRSSESLYRAPLSWMDAIIAKDHAPVMAAMKAGFAGQPMLQFPTYRVTRPDGTVRWVEARAWPVRDEAGRVHRIAGIAEDITQRKLAETTLSESEERYRQMFEDDLTGDFLATSSGQIQLCNPAYVRIYGFSSPQSAQHYNLARFNLAGWPRLLKQLRQHGRIENLQTWHHRPDGRQIHVVANVVGIFDKRKQLVQIKGYVFEDTERLEAEEQLRQLTATLERRVDSRTRQLQLNNAVLLKEIAARKNAAEGLRQNEERLRLMIEGTHDYAIFMLDPQGRVTTWNSGAQQINGYREKEVLGRHFSRFYSRQDAKRGVPQRLLETACSTGRAESEGWLTRKGGSQFWASTIITALHGPSGDLRGFLKVTRDVTERRQAQEALRSNEIKLADFFDQAPFGLLWVGSKGHILRVNLASLSLFGCAPEHCLNHRVHEFHADPETVNPLLRRLADREVVRNHRTRIRRQDGRIRHVLIDASGLWEQNRMVHSRWFVRDITRRVELEREILVVAEREQQRLGQDLHDDLCQQLSGIEFLSQTLAGQLSARSRNAAGRAREIAKMVRQAIHHTRELAHGLSPVELETDGLPGALRELAGRTRKLFKIDCAFRCQISDLNVDPALSIHLYRMAQEAVSNALKHGRARRVVIELARRRQALVLAVKDDGVGFPAKLRNRKGMGLRVMEYRAGAMGGTLAFQRNAEGGTTVVCTVSDAFLSTKPKVHL